MNKFLKIVEEHLPDSSFGDNFDALMKIKSTINYASKQLGMFVIPVEGEAGTIIIELADGSKVKLKLVSDAQGSEEAEDPIVKNTPTSSSLAADLVKNDVRVKRSLEPAIRKVSDALNKYTRG